MNEALLQKLRAVTPEEQRLLDGAAGIERRLYSSGGGFTVDSEKMLARGQLIGVRPHTRFAQFPAHRHNYVEIIYMCEGSTTHLIDEKTRVTLETGDLLFLNQHIFHEILPAGKGDVGVNFIVLPEFFDTAFTMISGDNRLTEFLADLLRRDGGGMYLHFRAAGLPTVQNLVENMLYALVERQPGTYKINQVTMGLLFLQLLSYADRLDPGREADKGDIAVMQAMQYIDARYRDGSLGELAARLGRSPASLSRLIQKATGVSFKDLQQRKRLDAAISLLRDSTLPVSDIIAAVGYENSSYFYRIFKTRFSVSPQQYRTEKRKDKNRADV